MQSLLPHCHLYLQRFALSPVFLVDVDKNSDGTVTVSFNCGENAKNNIDTQGNDFTFTSRHYGVNSKVMASAEDPIISAVEAQ